MAKIILYLFYSFLSILPTEKLFSQTDSKNIKLFKSKVGLEVGLQQGYFKDQIFSLLNYSIVGKTVGLNYKNQKPNGKKIIESSLNFGAGKLNTVASNFFRSTYILADFKLSYLGRLTSSQKRKLEVFLGGQYETQIQYYDWNNLEALGYLATHGLAIKAIGTYKINNKKRIQSSINIPVFQILVRPPYNGIDEFVVSNSKNISKLLFSGKASTFNKYAAIEWQTNFEMDISKRFILNANYKLQYQKVFNNQKFIQLINQFTVGTNYKL